MEITQRCIFERGATKGRVGGRNVDVDVQKSRSSSREADLNNGLGVTWRASLQSRTKGALLELPVVRDASGQARFEQRCRVYDSPHDISPLLSVTV